MADTAEPAPAFGRPPIDELRNPWQTVSSRVAYENPWIVVHHEEVIDPSGRPGIYGVVRPRNLALGVLPILDDGSVILVGQYRYTLQQYSWEIPEGGGLRGTDPRAAIERELAEETGFRAAHWFELAHLALSNSVSDELGTLWIAYGLTPGEAEPESTEDLAIWRIPFPELVQRVWAGEITDSLTMLAVAKTEAMRLRGELPGAILDRLCA